MINKKLITDNMGLVYSCAIRFKNKGIDYEDLVQAGSLGISKAANAFDSNKNCKFSTYAIPVILGEIRLLFRNQGSIKISRKLKDLHRKILFEQEKFFIKNNRVPTITELSHVLLVSTDDIIEAINASSTPVSLNNEFVDIYVDSCELKVSNSLSLKQVLMKLDNKERRLIILRYFFHKTQYETAKILNTNQVKVCRLEKKILSNIRKHLIE